LPPRAAQLPNGDDDIDMMMMMMMMMMVMPIAMLAVILFSSSFAPRSRV
jgi:hypothetical protein